MSKRGLPPALAAWRSSVCVFRTVLLKLCRWRRVATQLAAADSSMVQLRAATERSSSAVRRWPGSSRAVYGRVSVSRAARRPAGRSCVLGAAPARAAAARPRLDQSAAAPARCRRSEAGCCRRRPTSVAGRAARDSLCVAVAVARAGPGVVGWRPTSRRPVWWHAVRCGGYFRDFVVPLFL